MTCGVDVHVHFYDAGHLRSATLPVGYTCPRAYEPEAHLQALAREGPVPLVVSVYMSVFPGPAHVLDSLDRFETLRQHDPHLWGRTRMLGVVNADPDQAGNGLLEDPRILGVRFTLHRLDPAAFERRYHTKASRAWDRLFNVLADRGQHVLLYAVDPRVCRAALRWIPPEIPVGVDHLGLFDLPADGTAPDFEPTLESAVNRGNVYFKGPGYRAAPDPERVAPHLRKVLEAVGPHRVLLGATDAPNVGTDPASGASFRDRFPDVYSVTDYTRRLADAACREAVRGARVRPRQLLEENALTLYLGAR